MTANARAGSSILATFFRQDMADQILMTEFAVGFQDATIFLTNLDGFVKFLVSEGLRMMKAVFGLCPILADEVMGRVTIIASRHGVVAGMVPTIVLIAHDMAVYARARIVAKIR